MRDLLRCRCAQVALLIGCGFWMLRQGRFLGLTFTDTKIARFLQFGLGIVCRCYRFSGIPQNHHSGDSLCCYCVNPERSQDNQYFQQRCERGCAVLQLTSSDHTNKLGSAAIMALRWQIQELQVEAECGQIKALIITGNEKFFSAGADLNEIAQLTGPEAFEFSRSGQALMNLIDRFPAPVIAAIQGYCMGGGMDLALACDFRIAAPNAVFGHRGASLGLITGWGGTQRLARLVGRPRALQMFLLAEMVGVEEALRIGLVDEVVEDPLQFALTWTQTLKFQTARGDLCS